MNFKKIQLVILFEITHALGCKERISSQSKTQSSPTSQETWCNEEEFQGQTNRLNYFRLKKILQERNIRTKVGILRAIEDEFATDEFNLFLRNKDKTIKEIGE